MNQDISLMNASPTSAPEQSHGRVLAWLFASLIALTWAIGLGLYAWSQHEDRTDAAAVYEPVALNGAVPPMFRGEHLALSGRPLVEHVVVEKRGKRAKHEVHRLVPLAWPDWRTGQAVSFVAQVRSEAELLPLARLQRRLPGDAAPQFLPVPTWLVHLEGSVPSGAATAFAEAGMPVADGAQVVRIVPSVDGRPAISDSRDVEWRLATNACTGVTAFLVPTGLILEVMRRRARGTRKAR